MDRKKLEALRAKYPADAPGASHHPEFKKAIETIFAGTDRRPKPYEGVAAFLGAPLRLDAAQAGRFGRARRGAGRRAAGPRRHQPAGRALRAAGGARRSSASGPTITCTASCRSAPSRPATSATCRSAAATAWPTASRTSRRLFTRIAAAGVAPLAVGGDHSITFPILKALGAEAARRPRAHRCPLRHGRPLRGRQVPPRRPVPAGGAGRRARPRAHHPDRHPRRRRVPVGVLLRQRHDGDPRRGVRAPRRGQDHQEDPARSSATARPTSPSTSTASIPRSRPAPARPRSAA